MNNKTGTNTLEQAAIQLAALKRRFYGTGEYASHPYYDAAPVSCDQNIKFYDTTAKRPKLEIIEE